MDNIQLTQEQSNAVALALDFIEQPKPTGKQLRATTPTFRITGPAGTGKTTIIKSILNEARKYHKVHVAAPTGKAAQVLSRKSVPATTIHRMMYEQISEHPLQFAKRSKLELDLIIIDEASMVSMDIFNDLMSYRIPIIFVGDNSQLEPIGEDPKILLKSDVRLFEIHRTAADNPIIDFATKLRMNPAMHPSVYFKGKTLSEGLTYAPRSMPPPDKLISDYDQIIVGKNISRYHINNRLRKDPFQPVPGDKLICLKNDYKFGVINGEQFIVGPRHFIQGTEDEDYATLIHLINDDGSDIFVPYWSALFEDPTTQLNIKPRNVVALDYAYAITCHKSQGSEWPRVLVIDEAFGQPPNRWRYTAATRAQQHLCWA
jgi:exodeoxyribonuclease-5